jgi:hypothetical protein
MKIGLSFSRCVRDIVEGRVDIGTVLVIIAGTDFDPRDNTQWESIWQGYGGGQQFGNGFSSSEWMDYGLEYEDRFRSVSIELWETGRLHQPRKFGATINRRSEIWLETVLPSSELDKNPAAKKAWDQFQTIAGLTGVNLNKEYQ